jgi:hypothetical protein
LIGAGGFAVSSTVLPGPASGGENRPEVARLFFE